MQSSVVEMNLHWFDALGVTAMKLGNPGLELTKLSIPMDEKTGHGYLEMMQLALGGNMHRASYFFKPATNGEWVTVVDITGEVSEPLFYVQSAWCGKAMLYDRRAKTEMIFGEGLCTFQLMDGFDQQGRVAGGGTMEVESFDIGYSLLCQLLGTANAEKLLTHLGIAKAHSANVLHVPRHICAILHTCFTSTFDGDLHKLHAQAKLLEFLCALAGHFSGKPPRPAKKCKPDLLHHLHEELTQLMGEPPCLDELSRRYGLSARTLNEAFKEEYGQSIYVFVKDHRLILAHESLQHSKQPLKLVAAKLGYSHVNHFINAFSKKFGYPPGSIQRKSSIK